MLDEILYLVGVLARELFDEDLAEDRAFEKSPSENLLLSVFASESLESDLGLLAPSCGEDSTFFFAPNDSTVFSKFLLWLTSPNSSLRAAFLFSKFLRINQLSTAKVGCVFPMVNWPECRMRHKASEILKMFLDEVPRVLSYHELKFPKKDLEIHPCRSTCVILSILLERIRQVLELKQISV